VTRSLSASGRPNRSSRSSCRSLAAEVAAAIARSNDASIEAIRIVPPDATEGERADAQAVLDTALEALATDAVETTLIEHEDVIEVIIDRSDRYDLTAIGATREGTFQQLAFRTILEEVGRRTASTVIMAKRDLGITSRLRRWLRRR
jgi:nucleotide-binding universal stress UspA family protein